MALDIMQTLVELLCPTYSAQSACNAFINQPHHQVLDPFGPLLYFLFFPTVFLILFIFVGSRAVFHGNKGINLLIGVAVFIFIIINGAYPIILWIGEFWFIAIFLLFFIYLFTKRHANGGGGPMRGFRGSKKRSWWLNALVGDRELDLRKIISNPKLIDDEIRTLKSKIKEQEDYRKTLPDGYAQKEVVEKISELKDQLKSIEEIKKRGLRRKEAA
jgi:hypothetical protein